MVGQHALELRGEVGLERHQGQANLARVAADHRQGGLDRDRVGRQAEQFTAEGEELEVQSSRLRQITRIEGVAEGLHVGGYEVAYYRNNAPTTDSHKR